MRPRLLLLAFLALHAVFPALWMAVLALHGPEANDWLHLKTVADHFVAGDWEHLYTATGPDALNPDYYWLYPPFALYLVAPLAFLPHWAAYATLAGLEVGALTAALVLLHRLAPVGEARPLWILAVALSAPALTAVVTGQSSALITLCVVGAASLWSRSRATEASALLGLLALKPNWGAFFGLFALARGEWRSAATMLTVVGGLCVISLPLGLDLWGDFVHNSLSNTSLYEGYEAYKLITLKGFMEAVFGRGALSTALWLACDLVLLAAAVSTWRADRAPERHLATVVLLVVAANPYAQFYDALVLVVPATVWWSTRGTWNPTRWRIVGGLVAAMWLWEHASFTWPMVLEEVTARPELPFSIVGPCVATWLILEALEAR